ncbi:hypothetical protein B0H14DRAFT_2392076 [Mycena olivaceomarginata]|nr:hypothetical protein B0H14DRAFT_2392076 [Mycena olivaceomarginata]
MLKTLNVEELERENNAARNYYLLEGLGLDNAEKETLWGGTVAPTKRKAETQGKRKSGKGGKRSKKQVEEEPEEANESDNKTRDEASEAEVASKVSGRNTAKAKGTAAKNQWALKAQRELEAKDYGDSWNVLVRLWWSREETAGFAGGKQSWPAKKRPQAVSDWVGRARNHTPEVKDASTFGKEFWVWWIEINPSWRTKNRPMMREKGPSDWVCMEYKGQNGFLNVLMLLKWWRDAMKDASPDWEEAVDDVTWVLQKLRG